MSDKITNINKKRIIIENTNQLNKLINSILIEILEEKKKRKPGNSNYYKGTKKSNKQMEKEINKCAKEPRPKSCYKDWTADISYKKSKKVSEHSIEYYDDLVLKELYNELFLDDNDLLETSKSTREEISKLVLENNQDEEYENLLALLDSYDLDSVEQGIELCVALGLAEVVQHLVKRGGPNGGFNAVTHVYTLKLTKPFWTFLSKVFAAQTGDFSPNSKIFKVKEYDPSRGTVVRRNIEIFAHDAAESWSEYSEDRFEKEVKLPLNESDTDEVLEEKKKRKKAKKLSKRTRETLKKKAKKANMPLGALTSVYRKGLAAWLTGHRQGIGQHQWAMARVNSFIRGGKTRSVDKSEWKRVQSFRKRKK